MTTNMQISSTNTTNININATATTINPSAPSVEPMHHMTINPDSSSRGKKLGDAIPSHSFTARFAGLKNLIIEKMADAKANGYAVTFHLQEMRKAYVDSGTLFTKFFTDLKVPNSGPLYNNPQNPKSMGYLAACYSPLGHWIMTDPGQLIISKTGKRAPDTFTVEKAEEHHYGLRNVKTVQLFTLKCKDGRERRVANVHFSWETARARNATALLLAKLMTKTINESKNTNLGFIAIGDFNAYMDDQNASGFTQLDTLEQFGVRIPSRASLLSDLKPNTNNISYITQPNDIFCAGKSMTAEERGAKLTLENLYKIRQRVGAPLIGPSQLDHCVVLGNVDIKTSTMLFPVSSMKEESRICQGYRKGGEAFLLNEIFEKGTVFVTDHMFQCIVDNPSE